jgi:DeoR family fructose operon transcriptional repressor
LISLNNTGEVDIKKLAAELNISEITARRDLNQLASDGLLYRTHGGAMKVDPLAKPHDFVNKVSAKCSTVKDRYMPEGGRVYQ